MASSTLCFRNTFIEERELRAPMRNFCSDPGQCQPVDAEAFVVENTYVAALSAKVDALLGSESPGSSARCLRALLSTPTAAESEVEGQIAPLTATPRHDNAQFAQTPSTDMRPRGRFHEGSVASASPPPQPGIVRLRGSFLEAGDAEATPPPRRAKSAPGKRRDPEESPASAYVAAVCAKAAAMLFAPEPSVAHLRAFLEAPTQAAASSDAAQRREGGGSSEAAKRREDSDSSDTTAVATPTGALDEARTSNIIDHAHAEVASRGCMHTRVASAAGSSVVRLRGTFLEAAELGEVPSRRRTRSDSPHRVDASGVADDDCEYVVALCAKVSAMLPSRPSVGHLRAFLQSSTGAPESGPRSDIAEGSTLDCSVGSGSARQARFAKLVAAARPETSDSTAGPCLLLGRSRAVAQSSPDGQLQSKPQADAGVCVATGSGLASSG
mmetsp:Transcript_9352/g.26924  ORF Transcript_9352/g.26924 Transcript_9352/m.26924 type:complete len:440 (+) Transcript_9352:96-1415(+)